MLNSLSRHSQIIKAFQPLFRKSLRVLRSLCLFASSFGLQKSKRDLGTRRPSAHLCLCQKHPCMKMTLRRPEKTRSGFPGRFPCNLYRYPSAYTKRRSTSSGFVSLLRTRDIRYLRSSGVSVSRRLTSRFACMINTTLVLALVTGMDYTGIHKAIAELLDNLPADPSDLPAMNPRERKHLAHQVERLANRLQELGRILDPIQYPGRVFDPSNPKIMGQLLGSALVLEQAKPLASAEREPFYGSGVYALYYKGPFDAYRPIKGTNIPIYVGKADPASPTARTPTEQQARLSRRLCDHAKSIRAAENLSLDDFECRYLIIASGWQGAAETYLIDHFQPVWNNEMRVCEGFRKHGDSPTTRANKRSAWDTVHPGRKWASREGNIPNDRSVKLVLADIAGHFRRNPPQA